MRNLESSSRRSRSEYDSPIAEGVAAAAAAAAAAPSGGIDELLDVLLILRLVLDDYTMEKMTMKLIEIDGTFKMVIYR